MILPSTSLQQVPAGMMKLNQLFSKTTMPVSLLSPVFFILLMGLNSTALATCSPPLAGTPCSQGGLAILHGHEPSLNLGAGNPIHLVTGNNHQTETDLPTNQGMPGLELIRHYNSVQTTGSILGTGWQLSYDTRLQRTAQGWQIVQADGSRVMFSGQSLAEGPLKSGRGKLDSLNGQYRWRWPDGTLIQFNEQGLLVAIHQLGYATIQIHRYPETDSYRAGLIHTIFNQYEQHLEFHYLRVGEHTRLHRVTSPLGDFYYQYDAQQRLSHMIRPDGMQRRYLYEAHHQAGRPQLLTGIALAGHAQASAERINTWAYDRTGRAIYASRGADHHPHSQVRLSYLSTPSRQHPGLTVVRDGFGKTTSFHTALRGAQYVLEHVHGSGCPGCARPGTQARYDNRGRLTGLNHIRLKRYANGNLRQLAAPVHTGWPGLQLNYRGDGRLTHWHSQATGTETMGYHAQGLPKMRRFANGDTLAFSYDFQNRPEKLTATTHTGRQVLTSLRWHGNRLIRIDHPDESEQRDYDASGRLAARTLTRNCLHRPSCLTHHETFAHDDWHRLVRHNLPEGGRLEYQWGPGTQLTGIHWTDKQGQRHILLSTIPGLPGYRYGNGLHLHTRADSHGQVRGLVLSKADQRFFEHHIEFDDRQRIQGERIRSLLPDNRRSSAVLQQRLHRYAYNNQDQLIISQTDGLRPRDPPESLWLAWKPAGELAARRDGPTTYQPKIHRDASGLPARIDKLELDYGTSRRLVQVRHNEQVISRYQHNAFGHRIVQYIPDAKGTLNKGKHFFYLGNRLVAESRHDSAEVSRRYIYAHHAPVAMIQYEADGTAQLFYIHADLVGAPRLVTDVWQNIRWQAEYSPLGDLDSKRGDITLDLRLPGQIADAATGWHDNLLRTYHPYWGQYLEPDPLGPLPISQVFGYAAQQPRRYIDPTGLLLFAFDGTRQSASTRGNVWKLSQHYLDGPAYYHAGPGDSDRLDWDAITAHSAEEIVEHQWDMLLAELAEAGPDETIPIDILGFSRGAALARHFGNRVSSHVSHNIFEYDDATLGTVTACVDLRFMGLFDSVAQFGLDGRRNHQFDLAVPAAWGWVAHAAALHEHRLLFPLLSTAGSRSQLNVIESPFIGAHSDIGGGILPANQSDTSSGSDLSNVALNWMLWQARAAAVRFSPLDGPDRLITTPILHDYRAVLTRRAQDGDRAVQSPDGQTNIMWQEAHPHLGQKQRSQTETFITRPEGWPTIGGIEAGRVDMDAYARWLHDELGWQAPPV